METLVCSIAIGAATATAAEDEPDGMAFDVGRFEAVVGGYLAVAGEILTDVELAAIPDAGPVITYEQAARFLTDHLRGDVYYRSAFRGQNLQRTRAQLALLGSMLDQEDDRTAVVERAGSR